MVPPQDFFFNELETQGLKIELEKKQTLPHTTEADVQRDHLSAMGGQLHQCYPGGFLLLYPELQRDPEFWKDLDSPTDCC